MAAVTAAPVTIEDYATVIENSGIAGASEQTVPALPTGFPTSVAASFSWTGSGFKDDSEYVLALSDAELAEINAALEHFKSLGLDGDLVNPETFPLPTVGRRLEALCRDVHHGKGFGLVRGIKPSMYCVEDLTLIFLGVQSYIADKVGRQDKRGNMLVHIVADQSSKDASVHHRHSTKSITFHNEEAGDVVAWLTRSTSAAGGKCVIASAYTVYNVLTATHPEMIRTLARSDWPFALPNFQCRPIIFYEDSKLVMNFGRTPLMGNAAHPRPEGLPSLTARQMEALDAVEAIARATEMHIQTQPGDIHFINNLAILHRRESFVDGQDILQKRHLVRTRLRSSVHGWTIPLALVPEWHAAFETQRKRHWHLEHMPPFIFPLRKYPN